MKEQITTQSWKRPVSKHDFRVAELALVVTAIAAVIVGAYLLSRMIERSYQDKVSSALQSVLHSSGIATDTWIQQQKVIAQSIAIDTYVQLAARKLLQTPTDRASLVQSNFQAGLKLRLDFLLGEDSYRGFSLLGPHNLTIAASVDSTLGSPSQLVSQPDLLSKLWSNEISITPVFSTIAEHDETLFVSAPVTNSAGEAIALFVLHINPHRSLYPLLEQATFDSSGQVYAFDDTGMMRSAGRFTKELTAGEGSGDIHLPLTDPGFDVTKNTSAEPHQSKKLTLMAAIAIKGGSGANLNGYRDYRGVKVVGAWRWNDELNLGIAAEQETSEAFALLEFTKRLLFGAASIAGLIIAGLFLAFSFGRRKLHEARRRLQELVDNSTSGIIVLTDQGIIDSVNAAAETMFGYKEEELIGQHAVMLIPKAYRELSRTAMAEYMQTGKERSEVFDHQMLAQRVDSSIFPIDMNITRLDFSKDSYFAGSIRDMTQIRENERALISAREAAEQASLAKSTFLATMSHEIRTPLNGIVGGLDMLAHTTLDGEQQELNSTAMESASMLQIVIDDILDFSKIEAGKLEISNRATTLEILVEEVCDALRSVALSKTVELLVYCEPGLPKVYVDRVRLKQILFNLVGNAIKFSWGKSGTIGRVLLRVSSDKTTQGALPITIQVIDNGIGMSASVQEKLFQPFTQGEEHTTRRFGGTGLGLVITKRLIEIYQGEIAVHSVEGEGSTFDLSLSLDIAESEVAPCVSLAGLSLVLVSDDGDVSWLVRNYCVQAGANIEVLSSAQAQQRAQEPGALDDCVVIIDDPGASLHKGRSISAVTALSKHCIDTGLCHLVLGRGRRCRARIESQSRVTLDVDAMRRTTLLNAVAFLAGRTSADSIDQSRAEPRSALGQLSDAGDQHKVLIADDNSTNRKILSQQLQVLGISCDVASDGQQALTMWHEGDYCLLLTDCHMPNMDGFELTRRIRREEAEQGQQKHLPIIAVTADAMARAAQDCTEAGMDDYLTKPLRLEAVKAMLEQWLPVSTQQVEHQAESQATQQEAVDPQVLGEFIATTEPLELLEYYLDFLANAVEISDQLLTAAQQQDLQKISQFAHKLKSSAQLIGASGLAERCIELENLKDVGGLEQLTGQFKNDLSQVQDWINHYRSSVSEGNV